MEIAVTLCGPAACDAIYHQFPAESAAHNVHTSSLPVNQNKCSLIPLF